MTIDVEVRNTGDDPFYVYGNGFWGAYGGYAPIVLNAAGKDAFNWSNGVDAFYGLPLPPNPNDAGAFERLYGGMYYGAHFQIAAKDLVVGPGAYTIRFRYVSPAVCSLVAPSLQTLSALWNENDPILSNAVAFTVTP